MRFGDLVESARGTIAAHALRARLVWAAVAIGVASVLVLVALGEGARGFVLERFAGLGANTLVVLPGKTETRGGAPLVATTTRDLSLADAEALAARVPGVRRVVPIVVGEALIEFENRGRSATVIGTTQDFLEMRSARVGRGSNLPDVELDRGARVCVVGRTVARELFGEANPLGGRVRIGDAPFRVAGVLAETGTSMMVDLDDVVLIPVANALRLFDTTSLFRIVVEVGAAADVERAATRITAVVRARHDDEEDFTVLRPGALAASLEAILAILTTALAGIAAVSLVVAGVGVMNVMVVSVAERTAEIGLMKALGASRAQIASLFLGEAIALSAVGGLCGLALGLAAAWSARLAFPAVPFAVPEWAIAAALGVAVGVGVVFGSVPALSAARLEPLDALRRKL